MQYPNQLQSGRLHLLCSEQLLELDFLLAQWGVHSLHNNNEIQFYLSLPLTLLPYQISYEFQNWVSHLSQLVHRMKMLDL